MAQLFRISTYNMEILIALGDTFHILHYFSDDTIKVKYILGFFMILVELSLLPVLSYFTSAHHFYCDRLAASSAKFGYYSAGP